MLILKIVFKLAIELKLIRFQSYDSLGPSTPDLVQPR